MAILDESGTAQVRERLQGMTHPVKLIHFTQELNLEYGRETRELLGGLAAASDNLSLETYNFLLDKEVAAAYGVDKVPATIVRNGKDYGIRFYGLPAGYEFAALLDAINAVSAGDSGLKPETRQKLGLIRQPLHLEVFVTPTCPHCPGMARLAHLMAIENDLITADCVEATEFPDLAGKYSVYSVPKIVLNGGASMEGAQPEEFFVDGILASLGIDPKPNEPAS